MCAIFQDGQSGLIEPLAEVTQGTSPNEEYSPVDRLFTIKAGSIDYFQLNLDPDQLLKLEVSRYPSIDSLEILDVELLDLLNCENCEGWSAEVNNSTIEIQLPNEIEAGEITVFPVFFDNGSEVAMTSWGVIFE